MTVVYSATSGLWGVVVTDFLLFVVAMAGVGRGGLTRWPSPRSGGLTGLFSHPAVAGKLRLLPDFSDWNDRVGGARHPDRRAVVGTWYPGAEPGGGGYIAQRMLAARNEKNALLATLWFNIAHYALRPWPWILVALASLVVYPGPRGIHARFPNLDPTSSATTWRYPAMLVFLPPRAARPGGRLTRGGLHVHDRARTSTGARRTW